MSKQTQIHVGVQEGINEKMRPAPDQSYDKTEVEHHEQQHHPNKIEFTIYH